MSKVKGDHQTSTIYYINLIWVFHLTYIYLLKYIIYLFLFLYLQLNVSKEVEREVEREVARISTPLQQDDTQDDGPEDQVEEPQQEPQPSGLANRFTAIPIADDEDEEEAVQPPPKKKGAMEMARDTYQAYQDHLDRLRPIENKMERCMDKYLSS